MKKKPSPLHAKTKSITIFVIFFHLLTYWLINCNVCFCPPGREERDFVEDTFDGVISKVLWSRANIFLVLLSIFRQDASKAFLDSSSGSPLLKLKNLKKIF